MGERLVGWLVPDRPRILPCSSPPDDDVEMMMLSGILYMAIFCNGGATNSPNDDHHGGWNNGAVVGWRWRRHLFFVLPELDVHIYIFSRLHLCNDVC